jgi:hypothetical protein
MPRPSKEEVPKLIEESVEPEQPRRDAPPPYDAEFRPMLNRQALAVYTLQQFTLSEKMQRWAAASDFTVPPDSPEARAIVDSREEIRSRMFGARLTTRRTVV